MKALPALAAVALLLLSVAFGQERPPNVVLFLADDLGYGDLGCYGQTEMATPHLDALAASGMRFTRCYAGSTVCAPSRCVLMTGLHMGRAPVTGNRSPAMPEGTPTLPGLLRKQGYDTMGIGKWGVGHPLTDSDPQNHGFRDFYGYVSMFHAHNYYPEFLIRDGEIERLQNQLDTGRFMVAPDGKLGMGVAKTKVDYAPELLHTDAKNYLRWRATEKSDQPFFLYLPTNLPHANNEGTPTGDGMEVPDLDDFADKTDWPKAKKGYASMVRRIDSQVGELVAVLKESGLLENTLFLFASDNGPHEEGGYLVEHFDSNGPLRGKKRDLYEGGIRVPFIASWPGKIQAGTSCEAPVAFQDLLPTLVDLAGGTTPADGDGVSIKTLLLGHGDAPERPDLYWFLEEQGGRDALLTGDGWKVIGHYDGKRTRQRVELFRLPDDIAETNDLAPEHPDKVTDLCRRMDAMPQGVGRSAETKKR